nr:MAG: hypothetical protein [Microvirus Sku211]
MNEKLNQLTKEQLIELVEKLTDYASDLISQLDDVSNILEDVNTSYDYDESDIESWVDDMVDGL